MNKIFYYLWCNVVVLFASLPSLSLAIEPHGNIGVVDMHVIWNKAAVTQDLNSKVALMEKDLSDRIKKLEQNTKNEEKELFLKRKSNPKKKEILKQLEDLKKRNLDFQRSIGETKARMSQICSKTQRKIYLIVMEVVEEIAKEKKFCVVLPENFVMFYAERVNITELVLERLDKRITSVDIKDLEEEK
jgi:outer membrane protein